MPKGPMHKVRLVTIGNNKTPAERRERKSEKTAGVALRSQMLIYTDSLGMSTSIQ